MLCAQCESYPAEVVGRSGFSRPEGKGEWDRLRPIICSRCGSVLPDADQTGTMLGKLSQLARFGLVDGGRPLLEPAGVGGGRARRSPLA